MLKLISNVRNLSVAVLLGVLAGFAPANAANALTLSLTELFDGGSFTLGSTRFDSFVPGVGFGDGLLLVDPGNVTLETVESGGLVGFTISGNGELSRGTFINFDYEVTQEDARAIRGSALWITDLDFDALVDESVRVSVRECEFPNSAGVCNPTLNARPDMLVEVTAAGLSDIIDANDFEPNQLAGLTFRARTAVETNLDGGNLGSFSTLYTVVPEPGTALLLGLGLTGLAASGRTHRRASRDNA